MGERVPGAGQVDEWMRTGTLGGRGGERTDCRMSGRGQIVADGFPKDKTPKLTCQLTWLLEIQRGRP